jgi:exopolysaccharide biosynthesis polyprenyl glycosylphosphotransferase
MEAARENAVTLSVLPSSPHTTARLSPVIAGGLSGVFCAIADLVLLSAILIDLALAAGQVQSGGNLLSVLSIRLSIGHLLVLGLCWLMWWTIFRYSGLYMASHLRSLPAVGGRVILATGVCGVVSGEVIARAWHHGFLLWNALLFWLLACSSTLVLRAGIAGFQTYLRPLLRKSRSAVVVGSGCRADKICSELLAHPEWNYRFLGFVDSSVPASGGEGRVPSLGRLNELEEILMRQAVDEVVIALPLRTQHAQIQRVISVCERVGVQVRYCENVFETAHGRRQFGNDRHFPSVVLTMVHDDYRKHLKRLLDLAGACCGLLLLSPLLLVVSILIKATSKGPVIFRQDRYGLNKRIFRIYKFRTMVINAEEAQAALEHMNQNSGPVFKIFRDPRITRIGAFLRKTSIDELPQLINVLRGDMSLVGPRPLNKRDVGRFSEAWLMRRFSVKPGLTCLWQVSGRSNVSFDRWIELDLQYIDHWSLLLDFRILAMTFPVVLRGTGAA